MSELKLKDKTIVISGGTKGVGRSLVIACLNQGANVVFGGRDKDASSKIRAEAAEYAERLTFVYTDLQYIESCTELLNTAMNQFGRVDGFVNYAGITPISPLTECDEKTYNAVFDINTRATFFCLQNAIRCMKQSGGGSIVLVGTAHSWSGEKDRAAYAASKGAVCTLFEHVARNYAEDQIRCNLLTMGWTPTEGEIELRKSQGISEQELHLKASSIIPMGRMIADHDLLPALLFLLSDESSMVTGANIRATGGVFI